ncbi:MAG: hypothetical protein K6F55_01625 [Eubacterium sp.]|nr:hypothetical protein [Eubacterium sp.]
MKKCLAVLLVAGLSLSMVACGGKEEKKAKATTTAATTEATTQAETQAETQAATEATTQAEGTTAATTEATTEAAGENSYAAATMASDDVVKAYATQVQNAVIAYDWSQFGDMIQYPITIDGNTVNNKDELVNLFNSHTISTDFVSAVGQPDVPDNLFANGQGICLADGNIWITDQSFDGISENGDPSFKVFAINGILAD